MKPDEDEYFETDDDDNFSNSVFGSLLEDSESCYNCGYTGTMDAKKQGYTCPDCRTVVLPYED